MAPNFISLWPRIPKVIWTGKLAAVQNYLYFFSYLNWKKISTVTSTGIPGIEKYQYRDSGIRKWFGIGCTTLKSYTVRIHKENPITIWNNVISNNFFLFLSKVSFPIIHDDTTSSNKNNMEKFLKGLNCITQKKKKYFVDFVWYIMMIIRSSKQH